MNLQKFALTLALTFLAAPAWSADYKIDPGHSFITFRIVHLGFGWTYGRFNALSGSFSYDSSNPEASKISVNIDPASVDTNHAERDKDLRENWFQVDEFPQASFASSKYTGGDAEGVLEGTLTMHGVSKPIAINVSKVGEGEDPWGNYRVGFIGTVALNRTDWGVEPSLGPKGESVELELSVEGIRQ